MALEAHMWIVVLPSRSIGTVTQKQPVGGGDWSNPESKSSPREHPRSPKVHISFDL